MKYINQITVTVSEARELEHLGFRLEHVCMHLDGTDTYDVYAVK